MIFKHASDSWCSTNSPVLLDEPGRKPPQAGVHCAEFSFPAGLLELKGKLPTYPDVLTVFGHGLYHPHRSIWNQNYFILRTLCSQKSCSEVMSPLEASRIGKGYQFWSQKTTGSSSTVGWNRSTGKVESVSVLFPPVSQCQGSVRHVVGAQ